MNHRWLGLTALGSLALTACGGDDKKKEVQTDGGNQQTVYEVARTSCGNIPILPLDYRKKPAPDACIAAIEASCCTQAEACAADADCKTRWDCLATCGDDTDCRAECTPPSNAIGSAYSTCLNADHPECVDLSCVGAAPPPPPTEPQSYHWRLMNFASQTTPMDNVLVEVCAPDDLACSAALSQGTTDADGYVTLELPPGPGGTSAYLHATGAAIAPTLFYGPRRFDGVLPPSGGFFGLDSGTVSALRGLIGAPDDPTRGLVIVYGMSCGQDLPAGLHFSSSAADASTVQVYDVAGLPSASATMTDGGGVSGHIGNHPAGMTTITFTDAATGAHHGSQDIIVRAGYVTYAWVLPSL